MKIIGNILWFIFGGVLFSLAYFLLGILLCITIIGIPLGNQCFKLAQLYLFPFGKGVDIRFDEHPIANILWMIFIGWELAIGSLISGAILCITIIGIPFGLQFFKLAKLSLFPFGAKIVER